MDSCRIQPDGYLTWHGKAAVRVEVQPNDDPLALNSNSERAEMLLMQDANSFPTVSAVLRHPMNERRLAIFLDS